MPGYAGFDTDIYPGDNTMTWIRANTNLVWCGYYLYPAPSHGDNSWMGKLPALRAAGWGVAPIYVGEQVVGPGSHNPCAATGVTDGQSAADLMQSEGFAEGSYVYLDLENGSSFTPAQNDYISAWCNGVTDGGYMPGLYCSHTNALAAHNLQPNARIWTWRVETIVAHPVPSPYPDSHPSLCGYLGAYNWQLGQNCSISVPKVLTADLDTSITSDPGAPDVAVA